MTTSTGKTIPSQTGPGSLSTPPWRNTRLFPLRSRETLLILKKGQFQTILFHCSYWPGQCYIMSSMSTPHHCHIPAVSPSSILLFLLAKTGLYLISPCHSFHLTTFNVTLKMEATCSPKTLVSTYKTTLCHHLEDCNLNSHHSVHLKIYSNQFKL